MGTTPRSPKTSSRSSQQSRTSSIWAMSAMEQPAVRLGRMTLWWGALRTSAVSAMKWTPQKTILSASSWEAAYWESLKESPRRSANLMISLRW